jgi:hypothetical protein
MLTEDEIRVLIVKRLMAACDSCNGHHINHVEGQIRALLAVLRGGKKVDLSGDCTQVLDAAGIPWQKNGKEGWSVSDKWLRARGCTGKDDEVTHPKLMDW